MIPQRLSAVLNYVFLLLVMLVYRWYFDGGDDAAVCQRRIAVPAVPA